MATEKQIPKLAGVLVEHQSGFAALSTEDTQWVIAETKKAIALFVDAVKNRAKDAANKLLAFVTTVSVPSVKRFVVDDHFKDGEVDGVKMYLGGNFKKRLGGKIEENVSGCDIRVHKLLHASRDLPIRAEIGEDNEETCLAHLWHFLKLQGDKGGWFIFYIRDTAGTLWAVRAYWSDDGWGVGASSVVDRVRWDAGSCVCSR